ncbi:TPA: flagellar hook-length control protein FliK [Xanthomonas vasicola pv. zeae]|uniref:Flagellar hook-length control protein FliK n=3 Tax=Xanthomonas vasicola TaxID=56459 RepID=A0AAE8F696_XANVA|nr:flagellar hook-length control protein FliK [Xanthomonas vasicola]AVQ07259.1 flagellar hook-length control protein FliK [Xanthomonas vasicola pv. vasculorum]AZM71460.1 flagellar hook-length control protein FliK [Xanthomonas vasicola pv. vasculorum]MBV6746105.1 flagellar hook-length control protein FliK [Xanthomonas vasicola pv. vasculorum NCPPB 890]MBV6891288.1 flagellar hook-length control protein FliK [Xanthomonas vasicola pv. vasculorum]MBV7305011.1 flagellar hook-length control protein F
MNPLSAFAAGLGALAGTGKKSSYSDPSSEPDAGQDQFARMLNPANTPHQAAPQAPERVPAKQAAPKSNQSDNNRNDDDNHDDATGDATARPRAQDGDAKPAQSGAAKDAAAADKSTAAATSKTGKNTKTATAAASEDAPTEAAAALATDAGWPPAGLGGFGMGLLAQALPGGDVLAAAAAALTASMAGAANAVATATALPTDATAANATASAGTALPALGALVPAAAAGAKPTSTTAVSGDAQTAALMGMAAKALEPAADDSAATAAPDAPAFVLPATTAPALTRLQDAAPIFSASPTPTPDLGSDNFDDAIGARMSWLADQKIGHAHIKVTPNEMGPVEVRLHLDGDKVNASFTAANADTRQALEQSLPRLREMLGQNGFQLGQADVGQQQQNPSGNRTGGNGNGNGLTLDDSPPVGIPSVVLRQRGLLDAYA